MASSPGSSRSSAAAGAKPPGPFGALLHEPPGTLGEHGAGHSASFHRPADGELDPRSPRRKTPADEASLDAFARHTAQLAPPSLAGLAVPGDNAGPAQVEARVRSSLEDLLPALVRRVAWSGDGRRGTVRLELGAGELAGATLLVHVDDGRVRLQLSAPPGIALAGWRERIADRLAARGLVVDAVEVD
jgi:hypothetical protein